MDHRDHVEILRPGVSGPGQWADIGSGTGAFTLALADLLGPGSTIYSIDRDAEALRRQEQSLSLGNRGVTVRIIAADYTRDLPVDVPPLDGIVAANTLHFQPDHLKHVVLLRLHRYLKPGGRLVVVEYNTDRGNHWVPYPFSYRTWQQLADGVGFSQTRLLATRPSRFLGEIYSAVSQRHG